MFIGCPTWKQEYPAQKCLMTDYYCKISYCLRGQSDYCSGFSCWLIFIFTAIASEHVYYGNSACPSRRLSVTMLCARRRSGKTTSNSFSPAMTWVADRVRDRVIVGSKVSCRSRCVTKSLSEWFTDINTHPRERERIDTCTHTQAYAYVHSRPSLGVVAYYYAAFTLANAKRTTLIWEPAAWRTAQQLLGLLLPICDDAV